MKSHNKAEKAILVALPFLVNKKETYHKVCFFFSTGSYLSSRAASSQVLSTYKGLTSVFGMGTGGPP